jgi:hypothetical protein
MSANAFGFGDPCLPTRAAVAPSADVARETKEERQ